MQNVCRCTLKLMTSGVLVILTFLSTATAWALPMPPNSKAATLTCSESTFAGYLCLWKNDPRDSKGSANYNAIWDYNDYGWYNEISTELDNHSTVLLNRWSISVTVFQDINYNASGTAGERCYPAGSSASNLKFVKYATGSTNYMNDSLSSHRNVGGASTC